MAGVRTFGDWRRVDRALRGLTDRGLFTVIHKRIAEYGVSSTKARFQSETDPQGKRWIPSRRALEEGGKTLTLTARLKKSISGKGTASKAAWWTNVIYAARHNYGDLVVRGRRSGGLPRRQIFGLSKNDHGEIREIVEDTLLEARGF